MIPVLGVPVLNRYDLLDAMLASIDEPIGRLYIVDNGGRWDAHFSGIRCESAHVVRPGANLGVAASWNLIVRANLDAPWWCFVNNDIVFEPGALARLASHMEGDEPRINCLLGFGAFGVNDLAFEQVGWFDENFAPIYFEDSDWDYRAKLTGLQIGHVYTESQHVGNGENAAREHRDAAAGTYYRNRERFLAKWGGDRAGRETLTTPFGEGGDPRYWTQPSLERLRSQRW
jgi:GT2 family glycosyltransferase